MPTLRSGIKLFDPLEIIEADRLRRDLLLVDTLAVDRNQLKLARSASRVHLCPPWPRPQSSATAI
jgi:hypothetical protein